MGHRSRSEAAARVPPSGAPPRLLARATTRTARRKAACTSLQNAAETATAKGLVGITHPFHPCAGHQVACVGERYHRYGKRLLLQVDENFVCSVPESWTDVVDPDPEIVAGGSRAVFRFADLLELSCVVEQLLDQNARRKSNRV
ncbi:hypothetical protein JW848_01645 [Candidatus Bipolaricaulota bacterium]|nr:hypothetical protein [Candidatus Bipolaricaulota bacterium]